MPFLFLEFITKFRACKVKIFISKTVETFCFILCMLIVHDQVFSSLEFQKNSTPKNLEKNQSVKKQRF